MSHKRPTKEERDRAKVLVLAAVEKARSGELKILLCAAIGHPPVVNNCFGQLTCARCEDVVGEAMLSPGAGEGMAIIGHNCTECRRIWEATTPEQRLMTTPWEPGK